MKRRKYKRAINAEVRKFNEDIKQDWLWNGRYVMSQKDAAFEIHEDHSGAIYYVTLILTDTKTGATCSKLFNSYDIPWRMWSWANTCIIDEWKVWEEKPNPNQQARLEGREPPGI